MLPCLHTAHTLLRQPLLSFMQLASLAINVLLPISPSAAATAINFPLYTYEGHPGTSHRQMSLDWQPSPNTRRPNLRPDFVHAVEAKLGLRFLLDKRGDLRETVGPEDIFDYIYALLHAPAYRTRYHEFLKREFAKVPLTSNPEVFAALVRKGADLLSLHLMESPLIDKPVVSFPVSGSNEVDAIRFSGKERRVWVNKSQYFDDVGEAAWSFQIGGYDVCHKWLSDRKATRLSYKEVAHFQRLVAALQGTIELMAEIDAAVPSWPVQ